MKIAFDPIHCARFTFRNGMSAISLLCLVACTKTSPSTPPDSENEKPSSAASNANQSEDPNDDPPVAADQAIAPFGTPEALLNQFDVIAHDAPAIDLNALLAMTVAESDAQHRLMALFEKMIPMMELDHAVWQKFDAGIVAGETASPLTPNPTTTRLAERTSDRVVGRYVDHQGRSQALHLVKREDGWWISGRTFEDDPEWEMILANIDFAEELYATQAMIAPEIRAMINEGEITSAEQARAILFQQTLLANPELGERLNAPVENPEGEARRDDEGKN